MFYDLNKKLRLPFPAEPKTDWKNVNDNEIRD